MRWQPYDSGWWNKAMRKAGGPVPDNETDHATAALCSLRAKARAEAEAARMQIRVKMQISKQKC